MKKAASERKGADLMISKTQIEKTAQRGSSIFSSFLGLERPLIKPAVKAFATAGLSAAAERVLKKVSGKGFGPQEVQLYNLVQAMTAQQKLRRFLSATARFVEVGLHNTAASMECWRPSVFLLSST